MLSTLNFGLLPDRKTLQKICKAIAVLDAIISQDWEFRSYSYSSNWGEGEEFCEIRNGEGDQMLILFREDGCVINGFAHELEQADKAELTHNLPAIFEEFIFGEPINTIGTTFCLWTTELKNWQVGKIQNYDDNSAQMLDILDGNPQTYLDWANAYFEIGEDEQGIPLETVMQLYEGKTLTQEMVLSVVGQLEDWQQLEADLREIDYPFYFEF